MLVFPVGRIGVFVQVGRVYCGVYEWGTQGLLQLLCRLRQAAPGHDDGMTQTLIMVGMALVFGYFIQIGETRALRPGFFKTF